MTKSVTLLFPGQGTQKVGMGENLKDDECYSLFQKANTILGYDLASIIKDGPEEQLKLTENTQPAILTHSIALYQKVKKILDEKNITVDRTLGHSLGEYSALVASGVLTLEEATKAVHLRGKFMQDAVPAGVGKMFAIMKVDESVVRAACKAASSENSIVVPANFNEPNQIVISGHGEACEKAVKWIEDNHQEKFRAKELPVSAPFHSSLMKPAASMLEKAFEEFTFYAPHTPYIANIDAKEYGVDTTPETIKQNLIDQVTGSVLWTQSIKQLPNNTICLEVGPGKVLTGLVRKINPEIKVLPLDKEESFEELKDILC